MKDAGTLQSASKVHQMHKLETSSQRHRIFISQHLYLHGSALRIMVSNGIQYASEPWPLILMFEEGWFITANLHWIYITIEIKTTLKSE